MTDYEREITKQRALSALRTAIETWAPHVVDWCLAQKRKTKIALVAPGEFNAFTMKDLRQTPGYDIIQNFASSVLTRYAPDHVTRGGNVLVFEVM